MPPHGPGSKFKNGLEVGRTDTEQLVAPPLATVNCGSLPSLEIKTPMSQRFGVAKLIVSSRSNVMKVPPSQEVVSPTTRMPVIETSPAVQFRSAPYRGPAHCVTGNA